MIERKKATFLCCVCGGTAEKGLELCSVNFHKYGELQINSKGNGYGGFFCQGAAHHACLDLYIADSDLQSNKCTVCNQVVHKLNGMKLAIYIYRKKGCAAILNMHDKCFKAIKSNDFPFSRFDKFFGG